MEAPIIYIKDPSVLIKEDFDMILMSKYDIFYRRIIEFVLAAHEGQLEDDLFAVIVDDDDGMDESLSSWLM